MELIENPHERDADEGAYSRVYLVGFYGCECSNSFLTGRYSMELAKSIASAANKSGLGVIGEPKITLFGETHHDREQSGATIEIVLAASGAAGDCWPKGKLRNSQGEVIGVGTVHLNLHYCNRTAKYDAAVSRKMQHVRAGKSKSIRPGAAQPRSAPDEALRKNFENTGTVAS